jgi:hypothetical protein
MTYTSIIPDARVEFEFKVNRDFVWVEASAWGDSEGIYKTRIDSVTLEGVEVSGILSDDVLSDIEDAIEPHVLAEAGEARATGSDTIPGPYPTF